jgi:lipopolysaccharide export system ATP-binding protein
MSPGKNKLSVSKLVKSYRGKRVVDGISFELNSGEVLGMLGPNGAGKTTTFYILVGLVSPEQGEIFVNGERIDHMPMWERARKGITYLPQEPSIFRGMTVEENLTAIAEISDLGKDQQAALVEQLLEDFGIKRLRTQMANTLSGGERRRTEIARSLVINPCFILLDEPFTGIDPLAIAEIKELVRDLKKRGIGVVITDHNVRETLKICDRALIINQGRGLIEGRPDEIVESELARKFYLGEEFTL